ncbi:MAG: hypothetical protein ACLQPD_30875 [Desulfomonilaceae bacterium]
MCDSPATSKEHVPPKCFFPEQKDLGAGTNYRTNLLTVPSCSQHNLSKSQDDEYVLFVITCHYKNEEIARKHFFTKVARALQRQSSLGKFIDGQLPIVINGHPSAAYSTQHDRFENAFDHMARALFFHHYGSKLNLPIGIFTPSLFKMDSPNANRINQRMKQIETKTIDELSNQPILGSNPEIFSYQFLYQDEIPRFLVRMTFYGGFVVIAYAGPAIPANPGIF